MASNQTKDRNEAVAYGRDIARRMFAGRTGHGGGPCTKRNLSETEIAALCALAFEAGIYSQSKERADAIKRAADFDAIAGPMRARQIARDAK